MGWRARQLGITDLGEGKVIIPSGSLILESGLETLQFRFDLDNKTIWFKLSIGLPQRLSPIRLNTTLTNPCGGFRGFREYERGGD
jgi:hypothetical protein